MKKVAVIPAVVLAALCTFTGCKKEEVEKVIAPLVSDGQTTESTEEAQEEKDPLIPEINTSVEIQAGSRVAVVSKSTSGEFWGLVKKGMEPVSYTHLDVYKRQPVADPGAFVICAPHIFV